MSYCAFVHARPHVPRSAKRSLEPAMIARLVGSTSLSSFTHRFRSCLSLPEASGRHERDRGSASNGSDGTRAREAASRDETPLRDAGRDANPPLGDSHVVDGRGADARGGVEEMWHLQGINDARRS